VVGDLVFRIIWWILSWPIIGLIIRSFSNGTLVSLKVYNDKLSDIDNCRDGISEALKNIIGHLSDDILDKIEFKEIDDNGNIESVLENNVTEGAIATLNGLFSDLDNRIEDLNSKTNEISKVSALGKRQFTDPFISYLQAESIRLNDVLKSNDDTRLFFENEIKAGYITHHIPENLKPNSDNSDKLKEKQIEVKGLLLKFEKFTNGMLDYCKWLTVFKRTLHAHHIVSTHLFLPILGIKERIRRF